MNAANETLEGGGGVDFAIHKRAGPELRNECLKLPIKELTKSEIVDRGRCDVGEAFLTAGYLLPAPYVIHTVAPLLNSDGSSRPDDLRLCYKSCLQFVDGIRVRSVAFCCLGIA